MADKRTRNELSLGKKVARIQAGTIHSQQQLADIFHITRTYVQVLISLNLLFIINNLYILGLFSLVVFCSKVW